MNADTRRAVQQIKSKGYWRQGQTLGQGGWGAVYSFASNWSHYNLYDFDDNTVEPICTITAESDETAIKAFGELFRLGEFAHGIDRVETKITTILEQL